MGELRTPSKPPVPVTLTWQADAAMPERGAISGTLPNGVHYSGRYYAVMKDVPEQIYSGAWSGAEPYWPDWPVVSVTPAETRNWEAFAAAYTGQTIAVLTSDDGRASMRCRFTLNTPSAGLARGGQGECKVSDGSTIHRVVVSQ